MGSAVMRAGSDVVFQMWDERNKKIHNTPIIAELEGEEKLNNAITQELEIGRSRLPSRFDKYSLFG